MKEFLKYIKANWTGYEIDSSEFWVEITSKDTPNLVRTFAESPYIEEKYDAMNVVSKLREALELVKGTEPDFYQELLKAISDTEKIFDPFFRLRSKDDLLFAIKIFEQVIKKYPQLKYHFIKSQISFFRKGAEETATYHFSLSGFPVEFSVTWYEEEEWNAVIKSVKQKADIEWKTWC